MATRRSVSRRATLGRHVPERARRIGAASAVLLLSLLVIGALAILPARTWIDQRNQRRAVEAELETTTAEVEQLSAVVALLQTDDEIERRARENFDLVFPGEESYRILPKVEGGESGIPGG